MLNTLCLRVKGGAKYRMIKDIAWNAPFIYPWQEERKLNEFCFVRSKRRPYPLYYGYGRKCKYHRKLLKIKGLDIYNDIYGKMM